MSICRAIEGGVELAVYVQPRASRSRVVGEHDGQLKVQLAAPPVEGEANAALVELLAGMFSVPRRDVRIASGLSGRRKRVQVLGVEVAIAERILFQGQDGLK